MTKYLCGCGHVVNRKRVRRLAGMSPGQCTSKPPPCGRDKAVGLKWGHERLQARKPYDLGLQVPLGLGDEIPLYRVGWRHWPALPRTVA